MEGKKLLKGGLITAVTLATTVALFPRVPVNAAEAPKLTYEAHVSNEGWLAPVVAGNMLEEGAPTLFAGTTGKALQAEAFKINLEGVEGVTSKYNVHSTEKGWTGWKNNGEVAGTTGEVLQAEAIKISVAGLKEQGYELRYRAHVADKGWLAWVTADESENLEANFAGTTGEARRMEALEIAIVKTEVAKAQDAAVAELTSFVENSALKNTVPGSDIDYAAAEYINNAIAAGYSNIYAAETVDAVAETLKVAKNDVVNATKEYVKSLTDTVYNGGNPYYGYVLTEENYNTVISTIEAATTIDDAIKTYEDALENRMTEAEYNAMLLEEAQEKAVTELTSFVENSALKQEVPGSDIDYAGAEYIKNAVAAEYSNIWAVESIDKVAETLETSKANILNATKEYVKSLLDTVYNNGEAYYGLVLTEEAYNEVVATVEKAATIDDAIKAYEEALEGRMTAEEYAPILEAAQTKAVNDFVSYYENSALKNTVPGSDMDYLAVPDINNVVTGAFGKIYAATSETAVQEAVEGVKAELLNATKGYVKSLLDTVYNNGEAYYNLVLTLEAYNKAAQAIDGAEDVNVVIETYEEALDGRMTAEAYNLKVAQDKAVLQLQAYVNADEYTVNAEALATALANGEKAIKEATTVVDVATALNSAKATIDGIETDAVVLEKAQTAAVTEFTSYYENTALKQEVPGSDMDYLAVPEINNVIAGAYSRIYATTTADEVKTVVEAIKADLLEATRGYVDYLLDTVYNYGFTDDGKYLQETDYKAAKHAIADATTVDEVIGAYNTALDARITY